MGEEREPDVVTKLDLSPQAIAARSRRGKQLTPGILTELSKSANNRIGAFIEELTWFGARGLPRFPSSDWPQRVPSTDITPNEARTLGRAFGWWVRLSLISKPSIDEATPPRGLLPRHVTAALLQLHAWILNRDRFFSGESDLERASIVLAWAEHIYRESVRALDGNPLLSLPPEDNSATGLLNLVPDHLLNQVAALGVLARDRLLPEIRALGAPWVGMPLHRDTVSADADLLSGGVLLELKCHQGQWRQTRGVHEFRLEPAHLRQLIGYALLDVEDTLGIHTVGIYAARYGLLWSMSVEQLIAEMSPVRATLPELREQFLSLWDR